MVDDVRCHKREEVVFKLDFEKASDRVSWTDFWIKRALDLDGKDGLRCALVPVASPLSLM